MGVCTLYIVLLPLAVTWISADPEVASHQISSVDKRWGVNNYPEEQNNYQGWANPFYPIWYGGAFGKRQVAPEKRWGSSGWGGDSWMWGDSSSYGSDVAAHGGFYGRDADKKAADKTIQKKWGLHGDSGWGESDVAMYGGIFGRDLKDKTIQKKWGLHDDSARARQGTTTLVPTLVFLDATPVKKPSRRKWGLGDDSSGSSGYDNSGTYAGIFGRDTGKNTVQKKWGLGDDSSGSSGYDNSGTYAGIFGRDTGKNTVQKKWGLGDDSMDSSGYDNSGAYGAIFGRALKNRLNAGYGRHFGKRISIGYSMSGKRSEN
ncbi:PREDICTED: uncharacterized protein LOC109468220 [Branchiostoma belcheri]|uniref:Uncharacterized protein LOC109468220 n=1 Tax=Branchiostoma belcheri TaxID=7741 RepID=A0A6P4YJS9_BRABE|nr:PREDICTED: uncharacterized protein LOC109468220 [Branchiostoma belcheri]